MLDQLKTLSPRAELYLCLSQAFRPPMGEQALEHFKQALVEDLFALHDEVALDDPHQISTALDFLADYDDSEALLVEYSRLFLSPPAQAPLNLGYYLDGALYGQSTSEMESLYQKYGMERDAGFKDLPDHLSLQCFFYAWGLAHAMELIGQEKSQQQVFAVLSDVRGAMSRFGLASLKTLIQKIDEAADSLNLNPFYAELARLLRSVLERDLRFLDAFLPQEIRVEAIKSEPIDLTLEAQRSLNPIGTVVNCTSCGKAFSHSDQMASMIAKLQADGLATDHLLVCPDCRTHSMGLVPMTPPPLGRV